MITGGNALILGGASGISKATAVAFALEGVEGLMIADLNLPAAQATVDECRKVATNSRFAVKAVEADVSSEESVEKLTAAMVEAFGRIDYCVNGAGIASSTPKPIVEVNFAQFKKIQEVNVNGTFLVTKSVSAAMATQEPVAVDERFPQRGVSRGAIVNLASVLGFKALGNASSYTTSKHAVVGLTRSAALDNIKHSIRVNCVCPSWVDTPMLDRISEGAPGFDRLIMSQLPMGRMGTSEEIADSIVFLCSPKASWINGSSLLVDGAMSIRL